MVTLEIHYYIFLESYLEFMQMTRLGSSMIPGFLAKSWYVTRCSVNFSEVRRNAGNTLTSAADALQVSAAV